MSSSGEASEGNGSNTPIEKLFGSLPSFEAMTIFNEERQMLYGWLAQMGMDASPLTADDVAAEAGEKIQVVADAFGEYAGALLELVGEPSEDAKDILIEIWKEDREQRTMLFEGYSDCDHFKDGKDDTLEMQIKTAYECAEYLNDGLAGALATAYRSDAVNKVGIFIGHVMNTDQSHEESSNENGMVIIQDDETIREKIVRNSIDVAKIAAGATIALFIFKRLGKQG